MTIRIFNEGQKLWVLRALSQELILACSCIEYFSPKNNVFTFTNVSLNMFAVHLENAIVKFLKTLMVYPLFILRRQVQRFLKRVRMILYLFSGYSTHNILVYN